jgi:hypothetical protein
MTTREQLGLNANWIPMDSSKSGGSDEFLVKKVNQLEEKVNGLELSGFKVPITRNDDETAFYVKVTKENEKAIATFYLGYANETSKVRFSYKGEWYTITTTNQVKFEVPEILDTKLAEYGVHCYYLNMILDDILIAGIDRLAIRSDFGNELRSSDSISSSRRKVSLELNLKFLDYDRSKAKIISRTGGSIRYDNLNRSEARNVIDLSPDTNTFIIIDKSAGYTNLFLHPDYKPFIVNDGTRSGQEGKIVGSPKIKTLQVLDIGQTVVKDEVEFIWKSAEESLKDKLSPMIMSTGDNGRGINGNNYGYYGGKSGYPVLVFSPDKEGCITYAYKSDLSEWLGYFTESILGRFIKNAKAVPNFYVTRENYPYYSAFSKRMASALENEVPYVYSASIQKSEVPVGASTTNNFYAYDYHDFGRDSFSPYRISFAGNWTPDYRKKVKNLTYRGHIGLTLSDFDDNKTVEVWTFCQEAINSNSANEVMTNSLSGLINGNTGEFISSNKHYEKWKTNKCVIHQTLQRVGKDIKVVGIEVTTLDVFFKNFIAKSEEWKTRNPDKVEVEGSPKGDFYRQWEWNELYDRL